MNYGFNALEQILSAVSDEAQKQLTDAIESHERIFVCGAGRSGLMLRAFAMRLAQAGRRIYVVGEVVTPAIEEGDLLILASASGGTASVCRCAEIAKEIGATVCAITARQTSPLAALSSVCILLPAPTKNDTSADSLMGTLFEEALLLFCDGIISELHFDAAKMRARHANLE